VEAPVPVVREVDEIGVLLGPADHLDGVRVLEAFVVAHRLEEEPEVVVFHVISP